jgi:hypothetical protein
MENRLYYRLQVPLSGPGELRSVLGCLSGCVPPDTRPAHKCPSSEDAAKSRVFSSPSWSSVRTRHKRLIFAYSAYASYSTGASGTGRTTFVNTLCDSNLIPHKVCDSPETAHEEQGIEIRPVDVGEHSREVVIFSPVSCPFRVGGRWHSHRPHYRRHPRIW